MRAVAFEWTKSGMTCSWLGFILNAAADGKWSVWWSAPNDRILPLVFLNMQAPGKDINEARQRAQAAAIVQHQLRHQRL